MGGVPHLAPYLPYVIQSLAFWISLQLLSAKVSPKLFPNTWRTLKPATRTSWHVHFVAMIHATIITPLTAAIWWKTYQDRQLGNANVLNQNRLYAFDQQAASVYAIALGYFVWDAVVSALVGSLDSPRTNACWLC